MPWSWNTGSSKGYGTRVDVGTHETDVGALLERYRDEWSASTAGSSFIAGARDGSLDLKSFGRWMAQDRHFIDGLYGAQARVIALASGDGRRALLDGLVALQDELDWFEEQSRGRGVELDVEPAEECLAFVDYLHTLAFAPLAVTLTAIWAVERSYLDAWSAARPGAGPYREFVEHWSNAGFRDYVARLQTAADEALRGASAQERTDAERAFRRVMAFEGRFWRMAEGAGSAGPTGIV
ncbi:MAG: TenA family transcriptional regulator [Dehalococcoidia bacterium]|nr:TenA family transcriptional regulator [Dehalococcoidia bacterium]